MITLSRNRVVLGLKSILGRRNARPAGLSRETIIQAFRRYLGRDPESEAVIAAHQALGDEQALAHCLMASLEYATRIKAGKAVVPPPRKTRPASWKHYSSTRLGIAVFGNCQANGVAALIRAMTGGADVTVLDANQAMLDRLRSGDPATVAVLADNDLILSQGIGELFDIIDERYPWASPKVRRFPTVNFNAYHPDMVYVTDKTAGGIVKGPMDDYHSAIALWAWKQGLDVERTLGLFRSEVYEALGYFDYWPSAVRELERAGEHAGLPLGDLLEDWRRQGCWLYSLNHPKQGVLADVVRRLLLREGIEPIPNAEDYLTDTLAVHPAWPVYPEIGQRLGVPGHYLFKRAAGVGSAENPVPFMGLAEFVAGSFETYARQGRERLACARLESPRYGGLLALLNRAAAPRPAPGEAAQPISPDSLTTGGNPYRDLPDYRFWRRAVERVALRDIDPVIRPRFLLNPDHKVASAGSCFAQHIAQTLVRNGFPFLVTEPPTGLGPEEAARRQFGVYSARFGNLYTARQLLQLFDRAFGRFEPVDGCWVRPDGRLVDAFRPQVEPDGFALAEEVAQARVLHLQAVRRMFEELDVFIFTLGLTEAWRSRADGAVYPLAPGVVAGDMDPARYEFVNFRVAEVAADLRAFLTRLRAVNPRARVLLTVSPVPLIATYEDRHALVATTYSKSVLRAAAEEVIRDDPAGDYFPSYELITGNHSRGAYFEADLRSVTPGGVEHAMRLFLSHYVAGEATSTLAQELEREALQVRDIICDEEAIESGCGGASPTPG